MEVFMRLNGLRIDASVDEQERLMLGVADGSIGREPLTAWIREHSQPND